MDELDNLSDEELLNAHQKALDLDKLSDQQLLELHKRTQMLVPDPVDSAIRGAAQGASFGFADEITAGAEALFTDKSYEQARDESRKAYKLAEDTNPKSYIAGEFGGSLATAAAPIGSAATLVKAGLTGAGMGAAAGLGASEAKDAAGMAKDTFKSGIIGGVTGSAGKLAAEKIPVFKGFLNTKADEASEAGLKAIEVPAPPPSKSVVKNVAVSTGKRVKSYFNPKLSKDWEDFKRIAKKNNIDLNLLPESVKFGKDSSASRAARNLAEGRFGEETLRKFRDGFDQVINAFDNKIAGYSKDPLDEITAGNKLRQGFDEGVSNFFDQMDITHNSIMEMAPGMQLTEKSLNSIQSTLNGIQKYAIGRVKRGITMTDQTQGEQLLRAVKQFQEVNGSYKQMVEALRDIGKAAYSTTYPHGDIPVDVKQMRKLYNELNDSLLDTVETHLGKDIKNQLVSNNKAMSEFFGDKSLVGGVLGDRNIAPEKAFRTLVMNGDSLRINALKKILPPEYLQYLKGAALENLTKRNTEKGFTFTQLHNALSRKKSGLSTLFEPDELNEVYDIVRLGDAFGEPFLSRSGTGASLSYKDLWEIPSNIFVDTLPVALANRVEGKAAQQVAAPVMRDVTPQISKAAAVFGAMQVPQALTPTQKARELNQQRKSMKGPSY